MSNGVTFGNLIIENFLSVSRAELSLQGQGLVLIEGVNEDDPSAQSNGAGKSSIVDAISWVLYGETARGVTGDTVVNLKAGKGCYVALQVFVDGVEYTIQRGRKHKDLKNRVELREKATSGMYIYKDHTAGTDKLTQEKINNLLGCSADIFNASIYMGQERMPDLPNMTDKALKAILEEALQLDKLDDALEICKERLHSATWDSQNAWNEMGTLDASVAVWQKEADWLEGSVKVERGLCKAMSKELDELSRQEKELEVKWKFGRNELQDALDKFGHLTTDIGTINREVRMERADKERLATEEIRGKIDKCDDLLSNAMDDQAVKRSKVVALGLEEVTCPACGRDHEGVDPVKQKAMLDTATADLQAARDKVEKIKAARNKLENDYSTIVYDVSAWEDAELTRRGAMVYDKIQAETAIKTYDADYRADLKNVQSSKVLQERALKAKHVTLEEHLQKHKELKAEIAKAANKRLIAHGKHIDANVRVETLEKVKHVLGRKGFRGEVLDQVTPYLNARTAHYLSQLTDDNITAVWSTITQNTAGDFVESFHIDVTHKSGVTKFNALSGGEKRKVRLATALALQDLVGTRAVKPIKLFVADEIDDAIDGAGLELLMGLLDQKAKDVGTVFVISHNDISDWVRNKITVVKSGGQTTFKAP